MIVVNLIFFYVTKTETTSIWMPLQTNSHEPHIYTVFFLSIQLNSGGGFYGYPVPIHTWIHRRVYVSFSARISIRCVNAFRSKSKGSIQYRLRHGRLRRHCHLRIIIPESDKPNQSIRNRFFFVRWKFVKRSKETNKITH